MICALCGERPTPTCPGKINPLTELPEMSCHIGEEEKGVLCFCLCFDKEKELHFVYVWIFFILKIPNFKTIKYKILKKIQKVIQVISESNHIRIISSHLESYLNGVL
ncbi:hypothetical protein AAZV13_15G127900 [Glycine max]